jgi:threonine/homoserine/homoserine lactone efflux protein
LTVFAAALFFAALSPGPAVAAIVARVLARGLKGTGAFCAGVAIGDVVWLAAAVLGLAFVAQTFAMAFLAIKYAGCAYLLYLAWKLWTAPASIEAGVAPEAESRWRLFLGGLALTMGNPKTMVFYLALLPNLLDLSAMTFLGFAELAAIILLVLFVVFGGYVIVAARARRVFTSPRSIKLLNRGSGAVMAGAAVAIATR